jgi:hypothetical protein
LPALARPHTTVKIVPTGYLVVKMEVVIHKVVPDCFYDVGCIKDVSYLLAIVDGLTRFMIPILQTNF